MWKQYTEYRLIGKEIYALQSFYKLLNSNNDNLTLIESVKNNFNEKKRKYEIADTSLLGPYETLLNGKYIDDFGLLYGKLSTMSEISDCEEVSELLKSISDKLAKEIPMVFNGVCLADSKFITWLEGTFICLLGTIVILLIYFS